MMRRMIVGMVAVMVMLGARPTWAKTDVNESYGSQAGYGTLAAVSNLIYMPLKLGYAAVGGVTGALAWMVTIGNTDVAESVWAPSLGGTYVITPAMFRGEEEFLFSGPSHEKSEKN